jgi:hypothetical protein
MRKYHAFDKFSEPDEHKFKACLGAARELARGKNGELPEWWERFSHAGCDEFSVYLLEKFHQSTG